MGATVRAMANTATPREQVEEMERIRLQTEYDRAALQHFDALPVGAPSLALGHPYPVSVKEMELASHMPHQRASVGRMHSDLFTYRPATRSSEEGEELLVNRGRSRAPRRRVQISPCSFPSC